MMFGHVAMTGESFCVLFRRHIETSKSPIIPGINVIKVENIHV